MSPFAMEDIMPSWILESPIARDLVHLAVIFAVAVLVSLTLSPALLSLAGRRALPRSLRTQEGARLALDAEESPRQLGHRWAELVTRHRLLAIVAVLAVLGTAAVPALSMKTALTDSGHNADGAQDRVAFDLITKGFGVGSNGPLLVTVRADEPAELPARADDSVERGSVFIPFHFREAAANVLTTDALDPFGKIPEFKFCAVRVEAAGLVE